MLQLIRKLPAEIDIYFHILSAFHREGNLHSLRKHIRWSRLINIARNLKNNVKCYKELVWKLLRRSSTAPGQNVVLLSFDNDAIQLFQ